jgi:hypothetical protein
MMSPTLKMGHLKLELIIFLHEVFNFEKGQLKEIMMAVGAVEAVGAVGVGAVGFGADGAVGFGAQGAVGMWTAGDGCEDVNLENHHR